MGLFITFLLSIFILIGMFIIKVTSNGEKIEQLSISIALGTMSCLIIFDLIPEVIDIFDNKVLIFIFSILGIIILKILDKFIPEHDDEHSLNHDCSVENLIHIGIVSSVAIILHNIIEGMAIYSICLNNTKLGLLMAASVGLHNIPMGMIIYTTLKNETKKKKISLIILVTLSTLFGGLIMFLINNIISEVFVGVLTCITLGMLLYIIIFELIPHILHCKNKSISIFGIIFGMLIIYLSSFFE